MNQTICNTGLTVKFFQGVQTLNLVFGLMQIGIYNLAILIVPD